MSDEQRAREREQVRDLVENHAGWKVLHRQLQKRQDDVLKKITEGTLCHDEYRTYTGELKGLRRIDDDLKRLLGQAQEGPANV